MSGNNNNCNDSNDVCVVCYKDVYIYSIGICEHPVCYECSTRIRVLCQKNECAICRQDLPKVVFTPEIKPFYSLAKTDLVDKQYNICFINLDIQKKFMKLLANTCKICKDNFVFDSFNSLKDHMRRCHELYYCDLCVENLKIFSYERRSYTRSSLAMHRRKGDIDDRSQRGHPLCEFCDQRYMDNDELYRHLRRDHLYCHFCDADGLHQYYSSYDLLRQHFREKHYLCEEGVCVEEKFTSVFRTALDLKAHKASVHCKQLSKAAAKQARTLELEFTLAPRNRMNCFYSGTSRSYDTWEDVDYQDPALSGIASNDEPVIVKQPDVQSTDEFPMLGGNVIPVVPNLPQAKSRGNVTIRSMVRNHPLAVTDENFPALNPDSAGPSISKMVNLSVSSTGNASRSSNGIPTAVYQQCHKASTSSNVSIQVNHEPNGTVTTRVSGPNIRIARPAQLSIDSDFPALGSSSEPSTSSANSTTQWKEVLQWTCSKSAPSSSAKSKRVTSPSTAPPLIQSGKDFPSLSKTSKSKKQSMITVVPSCGQNSQSSGISSNSNNNNNNDAKTMQMTKSKAKKKKSQKQNFNSNGYEFNDYRSNLNTIGAPGKQKAKQTHVDNSSDSRVAFKLSTENTSNKARNPKEAHEPEHTNKKDKKKNRNNSTNENSGIATVVKSESNVPSVDYVSLNCEKQRKRSELKIDGLNTSNNNVYQAEFPILDNNSSNGNSSSSNSSSSSSSRSSSNGNSDSSSNNPGSRPPGFKNPPPGFALPVSPPSPPPPPPGFSVKCNSINRLHDNNSLTFTNSSGESYSILPDNSKHDRHSYVSPPDFQKRNSCLVTKLNSVLVQEEKINEFRYVSGLFRGGTCDAQEYYAHCREVMGASAFESIFPELLVLLPDITKQRELFTVHKKQVGKTKGLQMCATCGQVLKNGTDFRTHISSHKLENYFPTLGKSNVQLPRNAWQSQRSDSTFQVKL